MPDDVIDQLLASQAIEPVLVDVGASGGTPRVWQPIRRYSTYVGFDGDTRDLSAKQEHEFRHAAFAHEVITADAGADGSQNAEVTFYLTRSPYCSSTLKPNPAITDNFLSADSFIIEREEKTRASTLTAVMDRLNLSRIDWMKIDTQGTDLRIYQSLRKDLRTLDHLAVVLACRTRLGDVSVLAVRPHVEQFEQALNGPGRLRRVCCHGREH